VITLSTLGSREIRKQQPTKMKSYGYLDEEEERSQSSSLAHFIARPSLGGPTKRSLAGYGKNQVITKTKQRSAGVSHHTA